MVVNFVIIWPQNRNIIHYVGLLFNLTDTGINGTLNGRNTSISHETANFNKNVS